MPFDSLPSSPGPNAESLVAELRNLPADFEWDYRRPRTCALGVAELLWPEKSSKGRGYYDHWRGVFGLSDDAAYEVFCNAGVNKGKESHKVTPDDVADLLEAHLSAS